MWREGYVYTDQVMGEKAEVECRVGKDDPARFSISRSATVDFQADGADSFGRFLANERCRPFERNVFVVARRGFRCGRKDGLRQAVGFAQAPRQRKATDFSGGPIFLPSRTGDVPAYDAFN